LQIEFILIKVANWIDFNKRCKNWIYFNELRKLNLF